MEFFESLFSPKPPERWLYFDEQVQEQIFKLIVSANEFLYLVSPYNKHPQHLRNGLTAAIHRGCGLRCSIAMRRSNMRESGT